MRPLNRRLIAVALEAACAKRGYWPSLARGKHAEARRLRAVARRKKGRSQ